MYQTSAFQRGTWQDFGGHRDLRHYEPILVGKYKGATSRRIRCKVFCEKDIRGSFKVMTFLSLHLPFGQTVAPQIFFGRCSYVSPNGAHQNFSTDRLRHGQKKKI